jgi:hypothetical protein
MFPLEMTEKAYLICARCEVTTYSHALWVATTTCPRCGAPVRSPSNVVPLSSHPRFGRADDLTDSDLLDPDDLPA